MFSSNQKTPTRIFFFVNHHNKFCLFLVNYFTKNLTLPGITYNVYCSPSSIVDVGVSAAVKADDVVESTKIQSNLLITKLNLTSNNLANYYMAQVIL